ncbi:hypothetical protein GTY41_03800 [Streptomyces sp. SID685]|uniref:hypothetical protein n=1 Tax=Streptomyces sp. SID685 TaxID=2690322 RepID=UPI001367F85C|nr:hypothetical protein [Streptomyces sp. SID685]MYR84089.1 hypothetical protein [Streptomyces sp. SID685]
MRLRDARDQIERDHPELTGTAKLEAIKALRVSAAQQEGKAVGAGRHCMHCDQEVKPVEKRGWAGFFGWLALLEFGSVVVSIVAACTAVDPDTLGGSIGRLILWPAAVHPAWLSIIAAVVAFLVTTGLSGSSSRRATAGATCPKCGLKLADPDRPASA